MYVTETQSFSIQTGLMPNPRVHLSCRRVLREGSVDAKSALSANHTASRKAGFARAERE
jgi:hypothetical protein